MKTCTFQPNNSWHDKAVMEAYVAQMLPDYRITKMWQNADDMWHCIVCGPEVRATVNIKGKKTK